MKTPFKPTPFNLSEPELDDLTHALRGRMLKAAKAADASAADAWSEACEMINAARDASFQRRSTQRRERSAKLRQLSPA